METQRHQLDALDELHNEKSPNEEPPQAPMQPPATLASTEPTAEVMINIQTESSQPVEDILTILEEEWGSIAKCSILAN